MTADAVGRPTAFSEAASVIERATASGRIPGAVLHVRLDGRVVHERAFGRRRIDDDAPLRSDDVFAVASLTKPLVAVSVLQLCERGRLALDDEVSAYLPEFAAPTVLVSYDVETGATESRPARRAVTVRDLLTHTAGIHHGFVSHDSVMGTLYERAGVVHDGRQRLHDKIRRLGPLPLVHDPGAAWTYGLSSDVAARLVEVVAGEPLDRYLTREVLAPLAMHETAYVVNSYGRHRVATRHVRTAAGGLAPMTLGPTHEHEPHVGGGGGLFSTVQDYGRFAQALLDGGRPVLDVASVRAMTSVQTPHVTSLGLRYGLSVGLATPDASGRHPLPVGGFGWYGIFGTWFWAWPAQRAAVLLFTHVLDPTLNFSMFSEVASAVQGELSRFRRSGVPSGT